MKQTDTITGSAIASVIKPREKFNKDLLYKRLTESGYHIKAASCASRINQLFNKNLITRHAEYGSFYITGTQRNALAKMIDKKPVKKLRFGLDNMSDIEKLCLYGQIV